MTAAEVHDLRARLERSEATRAKLRSSLIALKVRPTPRDDAPIGCRCLHRRAVATRRHRGTVFLLQSRVFVRTVRM